MKSNEPTASTSQMSNDGGKPSGLQAIDRLQHTANVLGATSGNDNDNDDTAAQGWPEPERIVR